MSIADYTQSPEDHQAILVTIKPVGAVKIRAYARIIDRINSVAYVNLPDNKRSIWLRYKRVVHLENNEWGEFQVHRRVAGLICLGKASSEIELATVYANFDSMKETYRNTLFDSRCFVFGMSKDSLQDSASGIRPDAVYYNSIEDCEQLEDDVKDFAAALFWVLESKRLDKMNSNRNDKLPLLMAPFERKDIVGIDTETRTFRRRVQGRMRKHVGDLSLMAGMTQEAFVHYQTAYEILKGANDWLWMAACLEGMCAASVIQLYPTEPKAKGLPRNASFSGESLLRPPEEKLHRSGSYEAMNGVSDEDYDEDLPKNCLPPDEIIERYRDAIVHYAKYTNAAIIEMEACIKATEVLIKQRKTMDAADFLQNVIYINLNLPEHEKVQRYSALSRLFAKIGFHRKAAFFKRVAAMQCVSPTNPNSSWAMCHSLLLEALDGFKVTLNVKERNLVDHPNGWPVLQIKLLTELILTARRMGDHRLAVRYLSLMLHSFHDKMTSNEKRETAAQLETLTSKTPGIPLPLSIDNGLIVPAVPFTSFPIVKSFQLIRLSSQLLPHRIPQRLTMKDGRDSVTSSPFIYTPMNSRNNTLQRDRSKVDFKWVENEACEVCLQVYNPLPFELRVANLGFLVEGLKFEPIPATITLPPESGPHVVSLMGKPKGAGLLTITGYTTNVLGVESHCRLAHVPGVSEPFYQVKVAPALPLLKISTSLPKAASRLTLDPSDKQASMSAAVSLLAGESCECEVRLTNCSKDVPVEMLDICLDCNLDDIFTWSEENVKTQLPLQPSSQLTLTLYIKARGEFCVKSGNTKPSNVPPTPTVNRLDQLPGLSHPTRSPSSSMIEQQTLAPHELDISRLQQTIEGSLNIQYSGGEGVDEYYRRTSLVLNVEVQPSVVFTKWTTIPATDPRQFHLVLDAMNATSQDLIVQYGEEQCEMALESQRTKRMAVRVDRFEVEEEEEEEPVMYSPPNTSQELAPHSRLFSQQLATMVDIRWHCPTNNKFGGASVEQLTLSPDDLDNIVPFPVWWEVCLNGEPHTVGEPVSVSRGEPLTASVCVTSKLDSCVGSIELSSEVYMDQENDRRELQPTDKVACLGTTSKVIHQFDKDQTASHECSYVFLYEGIYKLGIIFKELVHQSTPVSPSSSLSITLEREERVWKYRPPVEVHVM
ncbi:trafficking protein particle complex subunit 9-like [Diadema antillarum]|uniref:trafficking protein particle complex subunit 9-like n=1 Tax=Diadema antillarum TaxID=105358 RepID=UPI003A8A7185